ncbi:hypothetical protein Scep_010687 [Stephania cephalantha]|uniref:Rapid ALkalinization Factor n=1 Tax=Stephania cephalantha TaxID=152367 RepID=A0AAP0JVI9_9MAGN
MGTNPLIFVLSMLLLMNNIYATTKMSISTYYSTTSSSGSHEACTNGSTIGECEEAAEMEMESEISRRFLAGSQTIGYGSLKPDQPACSGGERGGSYSGHCLPPESNAYNRGCSKGHYCRSN